VATTKFGASAYLVKPVDPDQMRVMLQELIAAAPALPASVPSPVPATPTAVKLPEIKKPVRPAPVKLTPTPTQPAVASGNTADQMRTALTVWLREQVATGSTYDQIMDRIEEHVLRELLRQYNNRSTHLARALDINRVTLLKRRKLFKIDA
jgi:DNA-binding NtrC family response regulator